jgi:hypothetical protein
MFDPVAEISRRAKLFAKRLERGEQNAEQRLRALPYEGPLADAQHKHCLAVIAKELGFSSHDHAARVLRAEPHEEGHGTFLHAYGGFTNNWFVDYEEARAAVKPGLTYLIGYKRQYVVVERGYIEHIGLDPDDPDFQRVEWDLARPKDRDAAMRLYARRVRALPQEGERA